jgi:hypothetical protein
VAFGVGVYECDKKVWGPHCDFVENLWGSSLFVFVFLEFFFCFSRLFLCADIKNKKYYFDIFLNKKYQNKKYFKKQLRLKYKIII